VERKHQDISKKTCSLIFQSNIPKAYWNYVASHAVYLINRLLSVILKGKTPYDLLHNVPLTYLNLKTFYCLCFASTLESNKNKLSTRARKGVFLGYKHSIKGYIVLDIHTREIFISRNVIFYEDVFPYKDPDNKTEIYHEEENESNCSRDFLNEHINTNIGSQAFDDYNNNNQAQMPEFMQSEGVLNNIIDVPIETQNDRRSSRTRRIPGYLSNYEHHVNSFLNNPYEKNKFKTAYPISIVLSNKSLSEKHLRYTLAISGDIEPQT